MMLVVASLLTGFGGALFMVRHGLRLGFIDHPDHRSAHAAPVPRGGGIGILAGMVGSGLFLGMPPLLLLAMAMVGLVSFADDRFGLPAWLRLGFHLLAAALVVGGSGEVVGLGAPWAFCFWVLFIAGTGNIFNFMDGIDGMAGVSGLIAYVLLGLFALAAQADSALSLLCFAVAAACLGFLPCNYPRARVFMGDVGSVSLGFLFAALVFMLHDDARSFLIMVSLLLPFYVDATLTLLSRATRKANLFTPHADHLYQRLVGAYRLPHTTVTMVYGGLQLTIGYVILTYREDWPFFLFLLSSCLLFALHALLNKKMTP
jgi:Fuc2NAc and GlcNAc transferase